MPTLHWIGKDKVVKHHHEVPFKTLRREYVYTAPEGKSANSTGNRIIHGDNLEALKSLLPEFEGRVNCIYIDPPYNTGNEGWVYNDNVNDPRIQKWLAKVVGKEEEDLTRHDKWLCMMYPRLKLLGKLLDKNGSLVISIGHHEVFNLMQVCKELFGHKQIVCITVQSSGGKPSGGFNYQHEYLIFITPNDFEPNALLSVGGNSRSPFEGLTLATFNKVQRPNQTYPIFIDIFTGALTGVGDSLSERVKKGTYAGDLADFEFDYNEAPTGTIAVWPVTSKGNECVWRLIPSRLLSDWEKGYIKISPNKTKTNKNEFSVQYLPEGVIKKIAKKELEVTGTEKGAPTLCFGENKTVGGEIPTIWNEKSFYTVKGTTLINDIFGKKEFSYPKSLDYITEILRAISSKDDIILDSFAGSGSTAHAVLALNVEDNGSRTFILTEMLDYAEDVTAERVRRVMGGYGEGDKMVDGLGGGFEYYTVGEALFNEDGNLNEAVPVEEVRRYVAYSEGVEYGLSDMSPYFIGQANEAAYLFHYEPDQATTLDFEFLSTLKLTKESRPATLVIYADNCLLSQEQLQMHGIIFKKNPSRHYAILGLEAAMELKDYQRSVINDLVNFLEYLEAYKTTSMAFREYWNDRGASKMENYKENIKGVPHVCIKVPTAGGKTFLAANALKPILDTVNPESTGQPRVVIWLVPSLTILEQTARNFSDPSHPYRQRLNTHFNGRVEIYDKQSLLQGAGFSPDAIQGQLSLTLLSFDSLRARNKDDRKIFQENGNLATFEVADEDILGDADPTALINIIRALKPVLIVDESHNAESDLSVEMLKNLNPSFILDLTATPRNNSNIISFVDALALKKESMVKLPVIVYNRTDKTDVVNTALQLRNKLEKLAIAEEKVTGKYIRPIVLFQAEPKTNDDKETFLKIKETLLKLKIPKEQIAIKTSGINELKNVNLMSSGCHVRYIITVNALKEGWDCPFAYILASLADKSSVVDVEQVVGRVLRQPYVVSHKEQLLNMSYVLTASNRFRETLDKVVKGLNRAGFSDRDYRIVGDVVDQKKPSDIHPELELKLPPVDPVHPAVEPEADDIGIDITRIKHGDTEVDQAIPDVPTKDDTLAELTAHAEEANAEFTKKAQDAKSSLSPDLESRMNKFPIKEIFIDEAKVIRIPQFFITVPAGGLFEDAEKLTLLEKENLLREFRLNSCDTVINFTGVDVEAYQIDLEETGKEDSRPSYKKIDPRKKERLNQYILTLPRESQVKNLSDRITSLVGNMYPIPDKDVKDYVRRILGGLTPEQLYDCLERDYSYTKLIKDKIKELATEYAEKIFTDWLVTGKIVTQPYYNLQDFISPSLTSPAIPKSLYMSEKKANGFEERVINEVANLPNIKFWHKNFDQGSTSFRINGFINHYPDFIVKTESGKIVLIETKGDDRDNSDSARKVKLGQAWVQQAGKDFKYFMVFDKNTLEGAYKLADFLELLRDI